MKFNVKNLGIIKEVYEIDLNQKLLIFTGYNNTGKTYLNYLLYGLYKLPYGRIEKLFFPLVNIEDVDNESICIQTDLNILFSERLNEIKLIYEQLLTEYCPIIYSSDDIKPEIEINFTNEDIEYLASVKTDETLKNQNFVTGYSGINPYDDKGEFELKDGILKISFSRINNLNPHYNKFKEKLKDILRLNVYIQFERRMRKIASFDHIYQRDYKAIVHFFPAER